MKRMLIVGGMVVVICFAVCADFVPIGFAGNSADSNGRGAVAYEYSIGQYEVTRAEFQAAVNGDSRISSGFSSSGNVADKPVVEVSWYEAAKYCNYLSTGDAYTGVYQFDSSGNLTNTMTRTEVTANVGVFYAIATTDEWYKAAYFKPDGSGYSLYANGTNDTPNTGTSGWNYTGLYSGPWAVGTGAQEQNGTYDMMGNVWERLEDASGRRFGGQYNSAASYVASSRAPLSLGLTTETSHGFRIVKIVTTAISNYAEIGNAENAADSNGRGAVDYVYNIGKHEITLGEFQTAANADSRVSSAFSGNADNKPVVNVTWYEAAKYCNWLTTGDAYSGAYQFDGSGNLTNTLSRSDILAASGTFYTLPTSDEWHKAAYFKPDGSGYSLYANGTSDTPASGTSGWNYAGIYSGPWAVETGAQEQNGTYDMMGNVWERVEDASGLRFGGQYASSTAYISSSGSSPLSLSLGTENSTAGFRVVKLGSEPVPPPIPPEPIAVFSASDGQSVISWTPVQGSNFVYSIYYSTNLMDGFLPLETNLSDTVLSVTNIMDTPVKFYKIEVQ